MTAANEVDMVGLVENKGKEKNFARICSRLSLMLIIFIT